VRLNRFFVEYKIKGDKIVVEDDDFMNQIRNVLRMNSGDKVILCDGSGKEVLAEIESLDKASVNLKFIEVRKNDNEPIREVTLYCSVLKKENFELVVQKAVEVGVSKIVPIITNRTVKIGVKSDRLDKIIKEAAEQSGRSFLPILDEPINFTEAVALSKINDQNLMFDISGQMLITPDDTTGSIGLFIGPEGGWEAVEIDLARKAGIHVVSLGKLTLRAETAAIVVTYLFAK
jgi:16S rRNA (uracil1498-N3)-methyltransferase